MRRTRALLAMVLALGMAADALVFRAPSAEIGQPATTAMIVERDQQGGADRESDEDEVVAVDVERRFIPVDVER